MKVIISHHQAEYLSRFSFPDAAFVFDDPAPEDFRGAGSHPFIVMEKAGSRSANRNAGLKYWLSLASDKNGIIEFFDGDRFPVQYEEPLAEMDKAQADILLYPCEKDIRLVYARPGDVLYMKGPGNPFFSCGFAIRMPAIHKIMEFNKGEFFSTAFSGWGGEDQYMGTVAAHLGLKCVLSANTVLNGSVGGDEGEHPDYMQAMTTYMQLVLKNGMKATLMDNVGPIRPE